MAEAKKPTAAKKPVAKPAAKPAAKSTTAKAPAKKPAAAKPVVKKAETKVAPKPAAKKVEAKPATKAPAKKPATATKSVAKKVEVKSTAKPAVKKTETKAPAVKKETAKNRKPLVIVDNIKKSYGKTEVLNGISFEVQAGERIAIVGANGAGKSTLSEIVAKIKDSTSGKITYNFVDVIDKETGKVIDTKEAKSKSEISSYIGIQFQDSSYPDYYRVDDLVKFIINASGLKISAEELEHLYETFDLKYLKKEVAKGLSGGQQQRLNILLAIVNNPKLLILDEVGTGLDVESRTKIKSYIKSYAEQNEAAILLVSHNSDEVLELVDRVIVIHNGLIFEDKQLKDIIKEAGTFDAYMENLYLNVFKKQLDLRANHSGRQAKKAKSEKVK